ncbi:MAG: sensor histidine kinase [Gemmataceae bacterium]
MNRWLQRLLVFLFIALLIVGGLGWATTEALRVEHDHLESAARERRAEQIQKALWRLDGRVAPFLAREDSRPYAHFMPLHAPLPALNEKGQPLEPGRVMIPSPLMEVELPEWMALHFQVDVRTGWQSPQVLSEKQVRTLRWPPSALNLANVTPERAALLSEMSKRYPHSTLLAEVKKRPLTIVTDPTHDVIMQNAAQSQQPTTANSANAPPWSQQLDRQAPSSAGQEQQKRNDAYQRTRGAREPDNVVDLEPFTGSKVISCIQRVEVSQMTPIWLPSAAQPDNLLFVRLAKVESREVVQGVVLDWPRIDEELRDTVADLFPDARLTPLADGTPDHPERVMAALPVEFDPGPAEPLLRAGWTPLRIGLTLAWAAALLALGAVLLGGWSLIDLSERRIRFVSAVTHELRTPLTTLRLYLDMLTSGLVREPAQRDEYLRTLGTESERLHRLIGNVLDFARLERQSTKFTLNSVPVSGLLAQLQTTWRDRCHTAGKELVVENTLPADVALHTDGELVQQIIANLIDNSCKYSQSAENPSVWLRALRAGTQVVFEVEDCGPGVAARERRSIFRPFRRGRSAEVTAGGVGLGLALARRWATMLGGRLDVTKGRCGGGACFRLELPRG